MKGLLTLIFQFLLFSAIGQVEISGIAVDSAKLPLPGVVVSIKGTKIATSTNANGAFTFKLADSVFTKLPQTLVLTFNYVGFTSQELVIPKNEYWKPLEITLSENRTALDHVVVIGYGTTTKPKEYVSFPWPPPEFSASSTMDTKFFSAAHYLRQIDTILINALGVIEYTDRAYYYIPNGFAMVTRIEQIHENGTSYPAPERWSVKTSTSKKLVLSSYLKSLFFPTAGYFRVIVFAITDKPFSSSGKKVKKETAINWVKEGLNRLPDDIGDKEFKKNYRCTALIYEFEKPESDDAFLLNPCPLTANEHLERAGIISALKK